MKARQTFGSLISIKEGYNIAKNSVTYPILLGAYKFYKYFREKNKDRTHDDWDYSSLVAYAYTMGIIQGIREERAKRKGALHD